MDVQIVVQLPTDAVRHMVGLRGSCSPPHILSRPELVRVRGIQVFLIKMSNCVPVSNFIINQKCTYGIQYTVFTVFYFALSLSWNDVLLVANRK